MSDMNRFLTVGAVFAEDLGTTNPKYTYTGTTIVNSAFGNARNFNGTSNYIKAGNSFFGYKQSKFSLSVWFKPEVNTSGYIYSEALSAGMVLRLSIEADSTILFGYRGSSDWSYISSTTTVSNGEWYHVVVNYDSVTGTGSMYLNGVNRTNQTSIYASYLTTSSFSSNSIGTNAPTVTSFFKGSIKNILIFNWFLTVRDILGIYSGKAFDYEKNIVSAWSLDSATTTGASVKDVGWRGLNHNAVVNGTPSLSNNPFGGKCLTFNGTTDYLTIADSLGSFDLSNNFSLFIAANATTYATQQGRMFQDPNAFFKMYISSGGVFGAGIYDGIQRELDSTIRPPLNEWHSYGMSFDSENYLKTFYDGTNTATSIQYNALNGTALDGLVIGTHSVIGLLNYYFIGKLDKAFFFNRALSQLEFKDLHERVFSGLI